MGFYEKDAKMVAIKELNENAYPGTKFALSKDKQYLTVGFLDEKVKKVAKSINLIEIEKLDNKEPKKISVKEIESSFNTLPRVVKEREKAFEGWKVIHKTYPNAKSFLELLPEEVNGGGDLTLVSDNERVNNNVAKLNKFLFGFMTDIAKGKRTRDEKVETADIKKVLDKTSMKTFFKRKENGVELFSKSQKLAEAFNEKMSVAVHNDKFIEFVKVNDLKSRDEYIALAKGRIKKMEKQQQRVKYFDDRIGEISEAVAKNVFNFALSGVHDRQRSQEIGNVVSSLRENGMKKEYTTKER